MTTVVRHPPGKERPRDAPTATLVLRRAGHRVGHGFVGRRHFLTIRLEARRGTTRPGNGADGSPAPTSPG